MSVHEDASDPASIQRALIRREEVRRVQESQFAAEKRQIERRSEALQTVLAEADDTLTRQSQHVAAITRETAEATADRTRHVTSRNAAVQKLAAELNAIERDIKDSVAKVEDLEQTLGGQRLLLGQTQLQAEDRQQQSAAAARQLNDEENRQAAASSAAEAQRAVQIPERRRLEQRSAELLAQGGAIGEATRELQAAIPAAESRRNEIRGTLKRKIEAMREQSADDASMIRSQRALLQDLSDSHEDIGRRRRRTQEEDSKERVATRRQQAQEYAALLADLERKIRAKTDALADEAQTTVTHLALETLPDLREDCRALFSMELDRRDRIATQQRAIVGVEAIEERISIAKEQQRRLAAAITDLDDQCGIAQSTVVERDRRIAIFEDSVAPLSDIEDSCRELSAKQRELSKQLADDAADHAVWKVKADEALHQLESEISLFKTDSATMSDKKLAEQRATSDDLQKLSATIRDLEEESRTISLRAADLIDRNKALDSTLEHIARQRRQIAEELALRRDAARAAAANLLSQLE